VIPLPDYVIEALAAHLAEFPAVGGFVFTNDDGTPIRRNRFGPVWRAATDAAGLPRSVSERGRQEGVGFHALRHTYASLLIAAGCSVKVVQARLGHATAQETLDTYAHLWPDDEDRTRAAIDGVLGSRSDQDRTSGVVER
jgi:integrase